jgi:hypothetical protein
LVHEHSFYFRFEAIGVQSHWHNPHKQKRHTQTFHNVEELKKLAGICRFLSQQDLCYLAWFDKRAVHMISNAYLPTGEHAVQKVRIHLRNKGIALDSQFDSLDGHAAFFAKLPERAETSKKIKVNNQGTVIYPSHRSMDCRFCADVMKIKKHTSFCCKKCEKPLCKGVCFYKWHSPSSFAR